MPRLPRSPRARAGLAALVVLALAVPVGVAVADGPAAVAEEELRVPGTPEDDGAPVDLDASVFVPEADTPGADADGRRAAVLLAHGYGGTKAALADAARDLARDGYVVMTYSARGFGASGGLIHLDSRDYEVPDASRLLDALAERDDVRLDAPGDPVVGVAGGSYGGALALQAAAEDDRVDAIVPAITWSDLGEAFFPQAGEVEGPGVLKQRWAALFFGSSCARLDPTLCRLYAEAATSGRPSDRLLELLERSSPAAVLDRVQAPTLLVQGQQDSLFGLDQADENARGIAAAGAEVAVRWVDGGHDTAGADDAIDLVGPARDWFDHHLRGGPDPGDAFVLSLPAPPLGDEPPEQREADAYPLDGFPTTTLPLGGGAQPVASPPGGQPAALTGLPGSGLGNVADLAGGFALAALPGASAVFETAPLDERLRVTGSPRVELGVTSSTTDATLFASAWVVPAEGAPSLPRRLVAPLHLDGLTPGEATTVAVDLPWSAYDLEPGQRLRVVVASTDSAFAVPRDARAYEVALASPEITVPTVPTTRVAGEALAPRGLVVAVVVVLLAAAGLALASRLRRRDRHDDPALAEVPLVVDGLVKEYADGFRAVDGVSWRAEPGQVVGLLGPNGAGKTTTMRMLVGLARPDAGRVLVLGREVGPGAPVLGRVGALIEGPGFLPHLTGRENLHAYWAATGRPLGEAHLEEALAVADLGEGLDRRVRGYSQGMRQRLGIAQAMLGRPEVLLLDEPTNGLDPPQIRAMRQVLLDYAASGRTVVVSSHLLAEVEQTCSHVVVMHRGRVVLAGATDELTTDTDGSGGRGRLEDVFMTTVGAR